MENIGNKLLDFSRLTRCMMPAAVSQTEMKMEMSCASLENGGNYSLDKTLGGSPHLMEVDVLRMLRYCKISGTVIKRRARKNLRPVRKLY